MTVSAIYMASLLDCGYASHGNFLENGEKLPAVQEKFTVHLVVKKCFQRLILTVYVFYNSFGCHLDFQLLNNHEN